MVKHNIEMGIMLCCLRYRTPLVRLNGMSDETGESQSWCDSSRCYVNHNKSVRTVFTSFCNC